MKKLVVILLIVLSLSASIGFTLWSFVPSFKEKILRTYYSWRYPQIPTSELEISSVTSQNGTSSYVLSNNRVVTEKSPTTAEITYPDGKKEIRYSGKIVRAAPSIWAKNTSPIALQSISREGLAIDTTRRMIALENKNETAIIHVPEPSIIEEVVHFSDKKGRLVNLEKKPAFFSDLREGEYIQYSEKGNEGRLTILTYVQV